MDDIKFDTCDKCGDETFAPVYTEDNRLLCYDCFSYQYTIKRQEEEKKRREG